MLSQLEMFILLCSVYGCPYVQKTNRRRNESGGMGIIILFFFFSILKLHLTELISAVTLQTFFLGLFCLPSDKDGDLASEASRWVLQYEYDTIGKQHLHIVINGINMILLIFVLKADAQPQVVMAQDISLDCLHLTEGFAYFLFIVCRIFCLFKKKNYTHL